MIGAKSNAPCIISLEVSKYSSFSPQSFMGPGLPRRQPSLSRHKWKENIRIDLKEACVNKRNWNDSAPDRNYCKALEYEALNLWVS